MAEEIAVNLSDEGRHGYKKFIQKILNRAKDGKRRSHGCPVLPATPEKDEPIEVFDVKLHLGGNYPLIVRIRRYDLFVIGYCMQDGQWFEFKNDQDIHCIPESQFLSFAENYSNMGGLSSFRVGYSEIRTATRELSTGEEIGKRKSQMRLICVMLSEATRFKILLAKFDEYIQGRRDGSFEPWMELLVRNWGKLSERMLKDDARATGSFGLPEEKGKDGKGDLNQLADPPLNIRNMDDAINCLGILRGDYPKGMSIQEFVARTNLQGHSKYRPVTTRAEVEDT